MRPARCQSQSPGIALPCYEVREARRSACPLATGDRKRPGFEERVSIGVRSAFRHPLFAAPNPGRRPGDGNIYKVNPAPAAFLLAWLLATSAWLSASPRPHPREGTVGRLARAGWLAHCLMLLTAAPFVWTGGWSVGRHAAALFLLAIPRLPRLVAGLRGGRRPWGRPRWPAILGWAFLLGGSFFLQRSPIFHLYATHDPAAYAAASLNLSRTGKFFHHDPVQAAAHAERPELLAIVTEDERLLPLNYGLTPKDPKRGMASFHGLFAEPLYLAVGASLFGERRATWIHWLALVTSALLLVSLVRRLARATGIWEWLAAALLLYSPLVTWLYREPLSEPLAQLFFLGMVHCLPVGQRRLSGGKLVMGLAAALLTRISALLYVPFAALAIWMERGGARVPRRSHLFPIVSGAALAAALATAFHASGHYLSGTIGFYLDRVLGKIAPGLAGSPPPGWALAALTGAVWLAFVSLPAPWSRRVAEALGSRRLRRGLGLAFLGVLGGAIAFRYGKLLLFLGEYVGGFPFVVYNLESWLLYAGPVVVVLGAGFWGARLVADRPERLAFLQSWLPFCAFFYLAFRFLPLHVQPNFQRYLVIELVPMAILGTACALAAIEKQGRGALARALGATSLAWAALLTLAIHHPRVSEGSLDEYRDLLARVTGEGRSKVAVVFAAPSWHGMTLLAPLSSAFGVPVLHAHHGFTHREQRAIASLRDLGYETLVAVEGRGGASFLAAGTGWREAFSAAPCFRYPSLRLSAPPLELSTTCYDFRFYASDKIPTAPSPAQGPIVPAWRFEGATPPFRATHWVGVRAHGPTLCRERRSVHLELRFNPEPDFQLPTVEINGREEGARHVHALRRGPAGAGHDVDVLVPPADVDCTGWNEIDVFFPPRGRFTEKRVATVTSLGARGRANTEIRGVRP